MPTLNEGRHPGELVMSEANGGRSRESLVIAASQTIEANSIVCRQAAPDKITAAASAGADNAGDATIALAEPPVSTEAKAGRYRGIATDATHVAWEDPDGQQIGTSTHGEAFDGEIKLTITAGDTATAANDEFYADVTAASGGFQHVAYDPDSDGEIAGLAIYPAITGAGETKKIAGLVRKAVVNGAAIAWPDGITTTQQTMARDALARLGIVVR
jgi:hypothetical protein